MSKERSKIHSKYTKTKETSINKNGYVQKYVGNIVNKNVGFLKGNKKSSKRESNNLKYQMCHDVKITTRTPSGTDGNGNGQ